MKAIFPLLFVLWCLSFFANPALADEITSLKFSELKDAVLIRRDKRGIPYIEAKNENDLYFAQGFTTASDRLWQMDLLRRTARGELAEIFGKVVFEEDKKYRTLGFAKWAETAIETCSPEFRAVLQSYTNGVNAYLRTMPAEALPPEFRALGYQPHDWTNSDSLVVSRLFAVALGETWYDDAFKATISDVSSDKLNKMFTSTSPLDVILVGKDKPANKIQNNKIQSIFISKKASDEFAKINKITQTSLLRVGLGSRQLAISNAWVVSGKRTASGKPLLANDPHLFPSAPSIWYLTHLSSPSNRVSGAATPGIPGIIIGRNEKIAWGITNLRADTQDLISIKFTNDSHTDYRNSQTVRTAEKRIENIKVRKGFANAETEEVSVSIVTTEFGPVFYEDKSESYALSWSVLNEKSVDSEAFYFLNRAQSYRQWRDALARYKGQPQSFVYTDAAGNIAYQAAGTIPLREKGDGTLPIVSNELRKGFIGTAKFSDLPALLNPIDGIIVSANNRMIGTDYPLLLSKTWIPPYRARRVLDLLKANDKMTVENFRAIQADTFSYADALFINEINKAKKSSDENLQKEIETIFNTSTPISSADSKQIALSYTMRKAFASRILNFLLGKERAKEADWTAKSVFLDYLLREKPKEFLPEEFDSYEKLLLACYRDAVEKLTKELGADRNLWIWGKLGTYKFFHPLASVPFVGQQFAFEPIPQFAGGSGGTVNAGDEVSMRMIVDMNNSDSFLQSLSVGQSGNPKSLHYKDQINDWKNVNPNTFAFDRKMIIENSVETRRLLPK